LAAKFTSVEGAEEQVKKKLEEKTHINKFGRPAETQEVIIFKYHTYIYREKSGAKTPQSHVLQTSNRNHTETNLL
jgi:hypothetical protein